MTWRGGLIVGLVLAASARAWAQGSVAELRSTASAVAGAGRTWDDEGQIGSGGLFGISVDHRVAGSTFVAASLDSLEHERSGRFAAEGRSIILTGAIVQRFGHRAAQPHFLGGLTLVRHRGTSGFPDDHLVNSTRSTGRGFVFGGGVTMLFGARFEAGPEVRLMTIWSGADSAPAYAASIGGRFGLRF